MDVIYETIVPSPIGDLLLIGNGRALTGLYMEQRRHGPPEQARRRDHGPFAEVREQLDAYFAGERQAFDVALELTGSEFQRQVWQALCEIPFAVTESYGQLAERIGRPSASRAVGAANGRNPVSIIVPCHRVIGHNGSLTGYGGGMERKRWLLEHEQACAGLRLFAPSA